MKYGVLTFSYKNFGYFCEDRAACDYTVNIGDYVQSIAVRRLYADCGIRKEDIITVDRDSLAEYEGPAVKVVMNGVFTRYCFPLAKSIQPIFVGFSAGEAVVRAALDCLRPYQPIGCRDVHTAETLERLGVQAYVTGCLTLSLPARPAAPTEAKLFVAYGPGVTHLPNGLEPIPKPPLLAWGLLSYGHAYTQQNSARCS